MAAQTQLRAESRKSFQASVHSFYRWALQRGLIASDPSLGLRTVKAPQGVPHPIPERELREAHKFDFIIESRTRDEDFAALQAIVAKSRERAAQSSSTT
jgi:site-specific recombinase XerD